MQKDATLVANNSQHCWMLHVASVCTALLHVVACCCTKFETGQTFQPTTPNISFVPWSPKRSATMLDALHSSSNIVGATHAHYAWFTKIYGLYPSHDALQVPKLFGVVTSVCTPLPTRTQQLPTLLTQRCWELLRPFASSLTLDDSFRLLFTYKWVFLPPEYRFFKSWNAPILTFSLVLHFAYPQGFIWNGIAASIRILLWLTPILFSFNVVLLFGLNL